MDQKKKLLVILLGLVVLIGASAVMLNVLSKDRQPQNLLQTNSQQSLPEDGDEPEDKPDENSSGQSNSEPDQVEAMDFTMYDKDGNTVFLSDFYGKPTVVNFWASWCPPCKQEMPGFHAVWEELSGDVNFLMIDLVDGQRETVEKGMQYIEEQGYQFPVYFDSDSDGANTYGIMSIPTTIFIDANGYIAAAAQGAIDEETLRKGIEMAIENADETSELAPAMAVKTSTVLCTPEYRAMSAQEAVQIMAQTDDYILLDVRTQEEYDAGHLEGAILIPHDELAGRAAKELQNPNAMILIYCRSGNRSEQAANILKDLEYCNVYDIGGMSDFPKELMAAA